MGVPAGPAIVRGRGGLWIPGARVQKLDPTIQQCEAAGKTRRARPRARRCQSLKMDVLGTLHDPYARGRGNTGLVRRLHRSGAECQGIRPAPVSLKAFDPLPHLLDTKRHRESHRDGVVVFTG